MRQGIDDRAALEAFMHTYHYAASDGLVVKNLPAHPVHARGHRGNAGAYFDFGTLHALEAHISELPPGKATKMHRHTCEALFYVLTGRGYSLVQEEGQAAQQVEWEAGDLFFTPMFAWHQHVNADPDRPVRYLEITTLPLMKALGAWRIETEQEGSEA
jgi:mannose-6-phosphate isomerase-like protein (cupin superfamily)